VPSYQNEYLKGKGLKIGSGNSGSGSSRGTKQSNQNQSNEKYFNKKEDAIIDIETMDINE